jgi:hypothetical protein
LIPYEGWFSQRSDFRNLLNMLPGQYRAHWTWPRRAQVPAVRSRTSRPRRAIARRFCRKALGLHQNTTRRPHQPPYPSLLRRGWAGATCLQRGSIASHSASSFARHHTLPPCGVSNSTGGRAPMQRRTVAPRHGE